MSRARSATFNDWPRSCATLSASARAAASRSAVSSRRWHRIYRKLSSEESAALTDSAARAKTLASEARSDFDPILFHQDDVSGQNDHIVRRPLTFAWEEPRCDRRGGLEDAGEKPLTPRTSYPRGRRPA